MVRLSENELKEWTELTNRCADFEISCYDNRLPRNKSNDGGADSSVA